MAFNTSATRLEGHNRVLLAQAMTAKMLVAAERYDTEKTTSAEYQAEVADVKLVAETSLRQQQNEAAVVAASQQQAAAASQQAVAATQQSIAKAFNPPRPTSTTCNTWGNTTNCRSY